MSALMTFLADASTQIKAGADQACAQGSCNTGTTVNGVIAAVTNTLIFLVGAISVIMIVIGGLRYVLSNGDSKQTESAKNTVLYAVVGLGVAIAAYAIVKFVVGHIK